LLQEKNHPIKNESLESLKERAIEQLNAINERVKLWIEKVRPEGKLGRFKWAIKTIRDENIAATAYLLGALKKMGIYDDVITEEDKKAGIEWVQAMNIGNEQYIDPALYNRKAPGWKDGEPWPSPAMKVGVNQYSQSVLIGYGINIELPPSPPPNEWPQSDDPEGAIEWIKTRPWNTDAWGAGSHAMRMATWLLQWYKEGKITIEPLIKALKYFYEIQDKETGLWGAKSLIKSNRINGTFKLFPLMRDQLDLPLPYAEKIIDEVMDEFYRPDYEKTLGACDEWDNWYVIALSLGETDNYRRDEIMKMAGYRIIRILELFGKDDDGLSYSPDSCVTNWIGFDMANSLPQGDVMGPGILSSGINVCVDLLGINNITSWTGDWHLRKRDDSELREKIISLL
jgi:hypothetical protein